MGNGYWFFYADGFGSVTAYTRPDPLSVDAFMCVSCWLRNDGNNKHNSSSNSMIICYTVMQYHSTKIP